MFKLLINLYENLNGKIPNEEREILWSNIIDITEHAIIEKKKWANKYLLNNMEKYKIPKPINENNLITNYIFPDTHVNIDSVEQIKSYSTIMCEMTKWYYTSAKNKMKINKYKLPLDMNPIVYYFLKRLYNLS